MIITDNHNIQISFNSSVNFMLQLHVMHFWAMKQNYVTETFLFWTEVHFLQATFSRSRLPQEMYLAQDNKNQVGAE